MLLNNAPNTAMILGAVFSGGDPRKMAEMLLEAQQRAEASDEGEEEAR